MTTVSQLPESSLPDERQVTPMVPVQPSLRIETIDVVRGFAILGILLVNMALFNESVRSVAIGLHPPATFLDRAAHMFIAFFAEGKFYSLFSILFGLGMAIQYRRAEERGQKFVPFWLRRMIVLLGIGLIHAYLIWSGDILVLYSLVGMVLLLFRKARPRTLLIWAVIFLLIPVVLTVGSFGLVQLGRMAPGGAEMVAASFDAQYNTYATLAQAADEVYATGNYLEITRIRAQETNFTISVWPFIAFNVLAMFLVGLYAGKKRYFDDIPGNLAFFRKLWGWSLVLGLIGNAMFVYFGQDANAVNVTTEQVLSIVGQTFGAPALAIFYFTSFVLLLQRAGWPERLLPMAAVGRTALTNYLAQSIICTLLFYGYGLGLYGRYGAAALLLLTMVIYLLQMTISVWWLRHYRFGPMEWLWRSLTYGQRQPMRRLPEVQPA